MLFHFDNQQLQTHLKGYSGKLVRDGAPQYMSQYCDPAGETNKALLYTTLEGESLYREICKATQIRINTALTRMRDLDKAPNSKDIKTYIATIPELLITLKKVSNTSHTLKAYSHPTSDIEYKATMNAIIEDMDQICKTIQPNDISTILDKGYHGLHLIQGYFTIQDEEIKDARLQKRGEKGGFEKGLYMLSNRFFFVKEGSQYKVHDHNRKKVLIVKKQNYNK